MRSAKRPMIQTNPLTPVLSKADASDSSIEGTSDSMSFPKRLIPRRSVEHITSKRVASE